MKSSLFFFILFSILLFPNSINARKDIGGYWRAVMKGQPMPEATQSLVYVDPITSLSAIKDFESKPRFWIYDDVVKSTKAQSFTEDFEPKPRFWTYDSVVQSTKAQSFAKDFEPRPNKSIYNDDEGEQYSAEDFESRPNVFVYQDDALKGEKSFTEDFEPRPSVSV